jgi:hypothetical protein
LAHHTTKSFTAMQLLEAVATLDPILFLTTQSEAPEVSNTKHSMADPSAAATK